MSFYNEEEDEELRRVLEASAIEASLAELNDRNSLSLSSNETNNTLDNLDFERDIETITDDEEEYETNETEDETNETEDETNETEDETNETEDELEHNQLLNPEPMNNDDDLTIALQASLVDYHKTEEEILSEIQEKSLQTIEDDKKRKLQREQDLKKEDDEIMEKILQESYESNIALQTQSNTIINNEFDIDEEEYMNMILHQIKEEEAREKRMKELNTQTQELQQSRAYTRTVIEEQDLEYEESLRLDIAKEQEKKSENKPIENKPIENKPIENKPIENKPIEKPLTKEEIRQARLAFYKQN